VTFDRDKNPNKPFIRHLWIARDRTTITIEVLMKCYKALFYQNQRQMTQLKNTVTESTINANTGMSLQQEVEFMSEITK
jgi:hypothetical protein